MRLAKFGKVLDKTSVKVTKSEKQFNMAKKSGLSSVKYKSDF